MLACVLKSDTTNVDVSQHVDIHHNHQQQTFITSPTGAVVKYCDEHVCVSVCLSARISLYP